MEKAEPVFYQALQINPYLEKDIEKMKRNIPYYLRQNKHNPEREK